MNYFARHAVALTASQARLADAVSVVTWNGKDRPVVAGSVSLQGGLTSGGFAQNANLQFEALVSDFTPDVRGMNATLLSYLGRPYKVMSINVRPGGLQFMCECNSAHQHA